VYSNYGKVLEKQLLQKANLYHMLTVPLPKIHIQKKKAEKAKTINSKQTHHHWPQPGSRVND